MTFKLKKLTEMAKNADGTISRTSLSAALIKLKILKNPYAPSSERKNPREEKREQQRVDFQIAY